MKQSCKDLFIRTELPIVWVTIRSDNIFNIEEVNGALAMDVILHNSLVNAKSEYAKISDLRFLRGYLLIDDMERWY